MNATPVAGPVPQLAEVRTWFRRNRPGRSIGSKLDTAYTVLFISGLVGAMLYGTASSVLAEVATPKAVPMWGPSLLVLAMLVALRWGTLQGPVVFAPADIGFLLGAPLPRKALASPRLLVAFGAGALAGALIAALAIVGLAGDGRGIQASDAVELVASGVLCGVLSVAGAWGVQCSARAARLITRGTLLVVALAGGLLLLAHGGSAAREIVLWSGPWGWAIQPIAGGSGAVRGLALLLLAVVTVLAATQAFKRAGACSTERHLLRATARDVASASITTLNARSAQLALRDVETNTGLARAGRLPRPRRPGLAILWRDATALLRMPARLMESALLAGGAVVLAMSEASNVAVAAVSALLLYFAAAHLLEPLRLEVDEPGTHRLLLRRPYGAILLGHVVVPAAFVAVVAALVGIPCAAAGMAPDHGAAIAVLGVLAVPVLTLCAAMSARRGGQLSMKVLFFSSSFAASGGGALVTAWVVLWPAAAAVIGGVILGLAANGSDPVAPVFFSVFGAYVLGFSLRASKDN